MIKHQISIKNVGSFFKLEFFIYTKYKIFIVIRKMINLITKNNMAIKKSLIFLTEKKNKCNI